MNQLTKVLFFTLSVLFASSHSNILFAQDGPSDELSDTIADSLKSASQEGTNSAWHYIPDNFKTIGLIAAASVSFARLLRIIHDEVKPEQRSHFIMGQTLYGIVQDIKGLGSDMRFIARSTVSFITSLFNRKKNEEEGEKENEEGNGEEEEDT